MLQFTTMHRAGGANLGSPRYFQKWVRQHSRCVVTWRRYLIKHIANVLKSGWKLEGAFSFAKNKMAGEENVVRSSYPDIESPQQDIYTMVSSKFSKLGDKVAITDALSGREYTYKQLDDNICKFSTSLRKSLGFSKGDVLCIALPNTIEYPVVLLGVLRSGGVASTCNPTYTASELAHQFKNSGAKAIVTIPACLQTVEEAAAEAGVDKIIIVDSSSPQSSSGNIFSYTSMLKECGDILDAVPTGSKDVVVLPYSSGTTGLPKGVMLTNFSIGSNIL